MLNLVRLKKVRQINRMIKVNKEISGALADYGNINNALIVDLLKAVEIAVNALENIAEKTALCDLYHDEDAVKALKQINNLLDETNKKRVKR